MARLFSYVVRYDFGFAPNPFHGFCTLATCKQQIRKKAGVGDWVIGTGSSKNGAGGKLVFAMRVTEVSDYDNYWNDERFIPKRVNLRASTMYGYGDNIYHTDVTSGLIVQEKSRHSLPDGSINGHHYEVDTSTTRVLISDYFCYWGRCGPKIPEELSVLDTKHRGHKYNFHEHIFQSFVEWFRIIGETGCVGEPAAFIMRKA
ncbi:MAG: hypothetical protein HQL40_06740 [Alphaproteobacteria bacterium]|nr:hypothetical protein [Alphaproteobacteria bacterium]